MNTQPLVSVAVMTYNSSKYVLETLDSIKDQTYQNIELIISDDASTDDTIAICNKWLDKHRSRFANVKVLVPPQNTGQSGNYNRAFRACTGEWIKEIDGDDLLLPNCLTDLMEYVGENPEAKYVFGKMRCFGGTEERIEHFNKVFDYNFFYLTPEQQLDRLLYKGNCVPSPTSFYCKNYMLELGFECDERIPYLEDYPKWIKLLRLGVRFYYLDKEVAAYRVGNGISTSNRMCDNYIRTLSLFNIYYIYEPKRVVSVTEAANYLAERDLDYMKKIYSLQDDIEAIHNSPTFKIGVMILGPLKMIKKALYTIIK